MRILSLEESKKTISNFFEYYRISAVDVFDVIYKECNKKKSWIRGMFRKKLYFFNELNFPKKENNFSQLLDFYQDKFIIPRENQNIINKKFVNLLLKLSEKELCLLSDEWIINNKIVDEKVIIISPEELKNDPSEKEIIFSQLTIEAKFYIFSETFDFLIAVSHGYVVFASNKEIINIIKKEMA